MKDLNNGFVRSMSLFCLFILTYSGLHAQCSGFPATTSDVDCASSTNTLSASGTNNVNSGQAYGYCGTKTTTQTFNINLSGGTVRICGMANITGTFNSGIIVVSCGATANFTSGILLNSNVGIVNYGTINVTGDIVFQNSGNYVYNMSSGSVIKVSGNITYPQNNGQNAYLMNDGYITVGSNFNAYDGGYTCLENGSQMQVNNLNYIYNCGGPNARFTFGSSSGSAIFRYTGTATVKAQFTTSANIHLYQATGSTASLSCGASSWGSAVITTNAPALTPPGAQNCTGTTTCWTVLAPGISNFTATRDNGRIKLNWSMPSESNADYFEVERSANGSDWQNIQTVAAAGNSPIPTYYQSYDNPPAGLSHYRLTLTDMDGTIAYSQIVTIDEAGATHPTVYPNPGNGTSITFTGWNDAGTHPFIIYNSQGQRIYTGVAQNGSSITIPHLYAGLYFIITDPGPTQSRLAYMVYQ